MKILFYNPVYFEKVFSFTRGKRGDVSEVRERRTRCRYFTGIQNKQCKEGIRYDSVRDESTSPYGFPCTISGGHCDKISPFTEDELDARDREIGERIVAIGKARAAIVATKERTGIIDCPCCDKGQLGFSIASNGHIHAGCSTAGCVRWME
jgi:hypothetical protein